MNQNEKRRRKYVCEVSDRHYRRLRKEETEKLLIKGQLAFLSEENSIENTSSETPKDIDLTVRKDSNIFVAGEPSTKIAKIDDVVSDLKQPVASVLCASPASYETNDDLMNQNETLNISTKIDKIIDSEFLKFLEITEEDIVNDLRYSDDESDEEEVYDESKCEMNSSVDPVGEFINSTIFTTESTREERDRSDLLCEAISLRFKDVLSLWAVKKGIPHNAVTNLLHDVREEIPLLSMPLDSRTLLKTPKNKAPIKHIKNGKYLHFSLLKCIQKIIKRRISNNDSNKKVDLMVGGDGAPVGNSSEQTLWLLYCADKDERIVEMIGIFCGSSKPDDPNEFLQSFVDEAKNYVKNGVEINGVLIEVLIYVLIFDGPAKSYLLGTKHHSGRYSCSKCTIVGDTTRGMHFPGECGEARTDEKFANNEYMGTYQQKNTVLKEIPRLGLVTNVVLDPMHLVYLGVMRKLLFIWIASILHKIKVEYINAMSQKLLSLRNYIPYEFARKPRSLQYIKLFKATELRTICMYSGPIVFHGCLVPDQYVNFLELHISITILNHPVMSKEKSYLDYAEQLLKSFVNHFEQIYGKDYVTFNVHNLLHLTGDSRNYGTLEEFSAFLFENYIGFVKKLIRKGDLILEQIYARCVELENVYEAKNVKKNQIQISHEHKRGPLPSNFENVKQYEVLKCDQFKLNCCDGKNNYILIDNEHIINVLNIVKKNSEIYVIGKKMIKIGDLYEIPNFKSSYLGIYKVRHDERSVIELWKFNQISAKCMILPFEDNFVTLPILHTYKC